MTKGRVKVEVYPNSSLFKDGEEMEALQLGSVQMLAPSVAKFGPLGVREFEVFDLPYMFDNFDEMHKVTNGPVGAMLFKKLEVKGIVGLAFWDNGFKVMSANKPIRVPADYKGLKMRIQSSKVLGDQIKALGAIPQVMAFSEVYQALQTGVVDGTENPPSNFYTQKMQEVQKYLALTDHGVIEYAVIANKKFWDGLPADIRGALQGAMKDATKFANDIAKTENDEALEAVRKSGKTQILTLTAGGKGGHEEGAGRRAQGERVARRQGHHRRGLQGDRLQAVSAVARRGRRGAMKFLDHLEEWLIAFLMGAATLLIFVAVLHRYAAGMPIPGLQDALLKIDLSWAQELCIYMFVWMAKFGAAYGVRTGIHVGVDVLINRLPGATRKAYVLFGLLGRRAVHRHRRHARRDLHLGHRAHEFDLAGPRDPEVDRLPVHPDRLLPDVLPLPAGGRQLRAHRPAAAP